ncbi:hypothetical protein FACS1894140_2400 [Spirochaetia bacterium]|nr:hypothetical protein FACS1894140_2400 [Spirochaetia bacterium]
MLAKSCLFSHLIPMTLSEFDVWYRTRYRRRTSSALTSTAFIIADLIGVMLSFGAGFFLVNLYDLSIINFKSFVTYWPYLPVFILIFQISNPVLLRMECIRPLHISSMGIENRKLIIKATEMASNS